MANKKYNHYNLSQAKRKNLSVSSFGGVDFSSQRFNVSHTRAIDSQNFIYRDGVIQKRHGYEQISKINLGNFNGIWRFLATDNQYYIVAHVGKYLYQVSADFKKFDQISDIEFLDKRSFAFVGSNRLWFLGGTKYVVVDVANDGVLAVEEVEDSNQTFMPTTSIGITYENAQVQNRALLDYPNALNMFRQNLLLSGIGKSEDVLYKTDYFEYVLDGSLLVKQEFDGEISSSDSFTNDTKKALSKIHVIIQERGEI